MNINIFNKSNEHEYFNKLDDRNDPNIFNKSDVHKYF